MPAGSPMSSGRRLIAALVVAFGLSFAQPAIATGQLFRVGEVHWVEADDHRRVEPDAPPSMPPPSARAAWSVELWRCPDAPLGSAVDALARGDPDVFLEVRFRAGLLRADRAMS